jgi:uncharacterized protein
MSISMYAASVPVYQRVLRGLDAILDKAVAWANERKIDHEALLKARLAPDMFHLIRQVQVTTDMTKGTCARLAGQDPPRFEDTEASFADLKARIAKTQAFLASLTPAQIDGSEGRQITLKLGPPGNQRVMEFMGLDYLTGFGTPNVYFHYSMVYAILRANGLPVGKNDFLA